MLPLKRAVRETLELLPLLPKRPAEFFDRWRGTLENRWQDLRPVPNYPVQPWQTVIEALEKQLQAPLQTYLKETADIESAVQASIETMIHQRVFTPKHNADFSLGRLCYVLCRALAPEIVIETGVAYGVNSAFILAALAHTGHGELHSIDLPPNPDPQTWKSVGSHIPTDLRGRWNLHIGASRRLLPRLLREIGKVDCFVHDSLHTYGNMMFEFATIKPYLRMPGVIISDDIHMNGAFKDWSAQESTAASWVTGQQQKTSLSGVMVYR